MPRTLSEAEFNQIERQVHAQLPPNLTEAEFNQLEPSRMAAAIAEAENLPPAPEGSAAARFGGGVRQHVDPTLIVPGMYKAIETPEAVGRTVENIVEQQGAQFSKAAEDYRQGHYWEMLGHGAAGLLPVLGPAAAAAGEQIAAGDIAGGLGSGVGQIATVFAPRAVSAVKTVPVVPRIGSRVPAEAAAVEWGLREGLPVDVGTATGSKFLRGTQAAAEESALGSLVSPGARRAQDLAFTAKGQQLAARAAPGGPATAETAGTAVRTGIAGRAAAYDAAADAAYTRLRAFETQQQQLIQQHGGVRAPGTAARPFTTVPLAVDIAPVKTAMRPTYEVLKREAELVPLMGDKARALTMLDRLMTAPDLAPLSVADRALGELKSLARVDDAFRRTAGQAVAGEAVANLEHVVRATAQQAGPDVFRALMQGRAATVNKFKVIGVLDQLGTTPEQVYARLTKGDATGITQLRQVAQVASGELPQVGRAFVEGLLERATKSGRFEMTPGLLDHWLKLGPETKQLLFPDPAHVKDLDHFFRLSKRMAEKVNPSGTAFQIGKQAELLNLGRQVWTLTPDATLLASLGAGGLAKVLLSPQTTRLLVQGLQLPVGATTARTAWAARFAPRLAALDLAVGPAGAAQGRPAE